MAIPTYPRQKDPQVMLHKIRDKKDQSSHVCLRFFSSPGHVRYQYEVVLRDSRKTVNEIELVYW